MTYTQALNLILNKQSLGIKPGLERIFALLDKMGNPQDKLKIIHIAGTNGKGSVASTIANALTKSGYKTGLFSSPWVVDYREQIQIDNRFISENYFVKLIDEYKDNDCTEFEFLTAIMYKYFADCNVDYAIIECGMGGKGDSTNVEQNNISVITSIALDHTSFLGDTIEKIAEEKSGILRKDCPCVLYPNRDVHHIFEKKCSDLYVIKEQGSFYKNNLACANKVLELLGVNPASEIYALPARQEEINNILLDGAHNVDGANALLCKIKYTTDRTAVIAMMKDKNVDGYMSIIAPYCRKIIATQVNNERSMTCEQLGEIAKKYCRDVECVSDSKKALELAEKYDNFNLVCGSFYLAREIRNLL